MASVSPFRTGPRRVPPLRGSLAACSLTRVIRSSAHKGEAAPQAAGWRCCCQECVLLSFGQGRKTEQITLSAGANAEMLAIDFLSSAFHGKFIRRFITYQSSSASVKSKILPFFLFPLLPPCLQELMCNEDVLCLFPSRSTPDHRLLPLSTALL